MKTEPRSSLYYNAYQYVVSWTQDEIGCIRSLDADKMLKHIGMRINYERQRHRLIAGASVNSSKFTTRCRSNLESARAFLAAEPEPKKLVFYNNSISVYTNDRTLYDRLIGCEWVTTVWIKQAELSLPPDTILLKDPQFQYRTYFRGRHMAKPDKTRLHNWISVQGKEIAASKSLREFLDPEFKRRYTWWRSDATESYFFIDHNSLQYETMLSMICPGMVRKTLSIVKKQ